MPFLRKWPPLLREHSTTSAELIVPVGTQVVLRAELFPHDGSPSSVRGAVAEIIGCPTDARHGYRVRFPDHSESSVRRSQFSILKQVKSGPLGDAQAAYSTGELERFVIYRCVVGSQAYGLNRESSDIDRRGIFLPPADLEWSLYGVPEQLDKSETQECYWELKKFLVLALKANPNILECLFTPVVEQSSEIADAVLRSRHGFLSKLVYQTYNGYVMSQFKRLEQDLRNTGTIKWKHAMHLIRLLLQGITIMQRADVQVHAGAHREALLAIREGSVSWPDLNAWRLSLHRDFDRAFQATSLPDAPDYAEANRLLIWARRKMVEMGR